MKNENKTHLKTQRTNLHIAIAKNKITMFLYCISLLAITILVLKYLLIIAIISQFMNTLYQFRDVYKLPKTIEFITKIIGYPAEILGSEIQYISHKALRQIEK